jgi:hypothetical protein
MCLNSGLTDKTPVTLQYKNLLWPMLTKIPHTPRDWEGQNHQWDYGPTVYNFNGPFQDLMGHQNILKGHFKLLYYEIPY